MGMIRNKIIAVLLGPAGIGLCSQLQNVQNFMSSAVPMGMQTGALKYLAEYSATDKDLLPKYIVTASKVFIALSLVTVGICLIFIKPLSAWTLDSPRLFLYLVLPLLGVPFLIQSQLWQTYLRSGLQLKAYSMTFIITALIGVIVAIPILMIWKLWGVALILLIIPIISYIVAKSYANRCMGDSDKEKLRAAKSEPQLMWKLLRFGGANFPVFALTLGIPLLIRTQLIDDLGITANGIYQAVFVLSANYTHLPFTSVSTYLLPKLCQLHSPKEYNIEVNRALRIIIILNTFAILAVLLLRTFTVEFLFSSKFLAALALFPMQMIGDHFRSITMTIQIPLIHQEKFRARNIHHILQYGMLLAIFYTTPPAQRLMGIVYAYAISWAFAAIITYGYVNWLNGYHFDRHNLKLVVTSTITVITVALLPYPNTKYLLLSIAIAIIWILTSVERDDWKKIFKINKHNVTSEPVHDESLINK